MDSPEVKHGDIVAFKMFALQVQSLVGMLQTLGPDGEVELRCGSHVARLITKLPSEMRADFRLHMLMRPGATYTLIELAEWLRYKSWCKDYEVQLVSKGQGQHSSRVEKKQNRVATSVLHGVQESPGTDSPTPAPVPEERQSKALLPIL